jgi:hypothetical protein
MNASSARCPLTAEGNEYFIDSTRRRLASGAPARSRPRKRITRQPRYRRADVSTGRARTSSPQPGVADGWDWRYKGGWCLGRPMGRFAVEADAATIHAIQHDVPSQVLSFFQAR